jgi:hypothetical protein
VRREATFNPSWPRGPAAAAAPEHQSSRSGTRPTVRGWPVPRAWAWAPHSPGTSRRS